jgi:hypothetical protein
MTYGRLDPVLGLIPTTTTKHDRLAQKSRSFFFWKPDHYETITASGVEKIPELTKAERDLANRTGSAAADAT